MRFPIRYKILAVLSAVVVAAIAAYLTLASKLFFEDKTLLIYELNGSNVRTLSAGLESDLKRTLDKLRLIAKLNPTKFHQIFLDEDELVKVTILDIDSSGKASTTFTHVWPKYLETYDKKPDYLDHLRNVRPLPLEKITSLGLWVQNVTLAQENAPPLMTIATVISTDISAGNNGNPDKITVAKTARHADQTTNARHATTQIIVADVRLDHVLLPFTQQGIAYTYAVDSSGHVLADSNQERVKTEVDLTNNPLANNPLANNPLANNPLANNPLADDPLVKMAQLSKVRSEVKKFEQGGSSYIGSYYQVGLAGVIVASRVKTDEAFAAAYMLIRKSVLYAAIIITAAFFIALLFSHSLTTPIQQMLKATQRVAKGDFTSLIHISTNDELSALASSFNTMTVDLKSSREQIEGHSRELEKKVQDRTEQLQASTIAIKEAQEALVHTTRLASVGEIAGRAAHEVLNPLTNITARLEKIKTGGLKADSDDILLLSQIVKAWAGDLREKGRDGLMQALALPSQAGKTMLDEDLENLMAIAADFERRLSDRNTDIAFLLKEAARINRIVSNMRQLTRVSGNRQSIKIHELLDEAVSMMKDLMSKYKIMIQTEYTALEPVVHADHGELLQVFNNLFRNSMQAIEEAQKTGLAIDPSKVWITTAVDSKMVQIRISDNGPGIAHDDIQRLFESSFTTKSAQEGTGLGLSITRRFIRAFKGEIILEKSIPFVETTFLIELPLNGDQ